ncbi:GNAT family N-acetyltransferase [Nocardia colli]|uniref:GNAT family N-acetyltransferase n=1 Tax=Nocardia colli TaxID=2545717 RepID=A0A5N0EBQ2_9NOCA|nr:GNAT family N-acetyltransferase [Nocardia colli]KAA8886220.1 GNAT family N-acetyltransferase [Nocardia colli]
MRQTFLELLDRITRTLGEQLAREARGLAITYGHTAEELTEAARRYSRADVQAAASIRAAAGLKKITSPPIGPDSGGGLRRAEPAPLGALLDAGAAGASNIELTRALKGLEREYGPYRLRRLIAWYKPDSSGVSPEIHMAAAICADDGTYAGKLSRYFKRDSDNKIVVHNHNIVLLPQFRGHGFATEFAKAVENYYRRSGVDRIELYAGGARWRLRLGPRRLWLGPSA